MMHTFNRWINTLDALFDAFLASWLWPAIAALTLIAYICTASGCALTPEQQYVQGAERRAAAHLAEAASHTREKP